MSRQIFIGLVAEGKTDLRFLHSIVQRTFNEIGFDCNGEVETVLIPIIINQTGLDFCGKVMRASRLGFEQYGIMILCVHSDADHPTDEVVMQSKITPTALALKDSNDSQLCRIMVPIVPIQMIEAWMLADKTLLKKEVGTQLDDILLGINREPEQYSDPKTVIKDAIRIARERLTKRRRHELTISDLYLPIGQKIVIEKLNNLASFNKFTESIRVAYRKLNLMQ
jgi:hypothetical protein